MRNQIQRTIRRFHMISPGQRIAAACSGGPDSTGLLLILQQLAPELGCTLAVVHFNHKWRSAESDQDELFVRNLAERLDLPFHAAAADTRTERTRGNLEQTARQLRYDYFFSLIESGWADRIAVGHTADDQAETVLQRLLRGAGNRGLAAIYPTRENWLIRPLLDTSRQDVLDWLQSRGQSWREDSSNQDSRYMRNRIRQQLLPVLTEWNPSIVSVLTRSAEIARDEEAFWGEYLNPLVQQYLHKSEGILRVEIGPLRNMPVAVARRFLRHALEETALSDASDGQRRRQGRSTGASDFGSVQRVLTLALSGRSGTTLFLPGRIRVRKEFTTLLLERSDADQAAFAGYSYKVTIPKTVRVPEIPSLFAFELIPLASGSARYNGKRENLLDLGIMRESLVLRNWQAGDSYRQEGQRKPRKIKELFQRWRVSRSERQSWPVVVAGGQIVWSRRWGVAEGFAPRPGSTEALCIREQVD